MDQVSSYLHQFGSNWSQVRSLLNQVAVSGLKQFFWGVRRRIMEGRKAYQMLYGTEIPHMAQTRLLQRRRRESRDLDTRGSGADCIETTDPALYHSLWRVWGGGGIAERDRQVWNGRWVPRSKRYVKIASWRSVRAEQAVEPLG